ncbi:dihydroxyacetone kinase subunit L [Rhodococcus sp. Eu-32]|uniref:dihydroxyacetone kinase subunit DhaL n=1 Tax=Rhodococcus sp. Eu-32 TaxID=1017319 RepID=UPI000DF4BA69|nr:dihydroxyacetone kinase subunit DhaL [Rhodococcus sp. Eu-32]RRQ29086.1 dihydroxyacetone kinase subunit L [Rhodococcus sp. Eu-32]
MTILDVDTTLAWITRFADEGENRFDSLTDLDRLVGDGDFGMNLRSGLRGAVRRLESAPPETPGEVFARLSDAFLEIGGTSGPLLGLWFGRISHITGDTVTTQDLASALAEATDAVQRLGGAQVGHKTMVDAMVPAAAAMKHAAAEDLPVAIALKEAAEAALRGVDSTREILASRGRASYVGEHARGVEDPGAVAIALFFTAFHDAGEIG